MEHKPRHISGTHRQMKKINQVAKCIGQIFQMIFIQLLLFKCEEE